MNYYLRSILPQVAPKWRSYIVSSVVFAVLSSGHGFASQTTIAQTTLNEIIAAGAAASKRFELDAHVDFAKPICLPVNNQNGICTSMFVYGIGVSMLIQDDNLALLQLVVTTENVKDEKDIGKAINAFVAYSADPHEQKKFDMYAFTVAICVLRKADEEKIVELFPLKMTSTGTGCVAEYEL